MMNQQQVETELVATAMNEMTATVSENAHYNSEASIRLTKLSEEMQRQFSTFGLGRKLNQQYSGDAAESIDENYLF